MVLSVHLPPEYLSWVEGVARRLRIGSREAWRAILDPCVRAPLETRRYALPHELDGYKRGIPHPVAVISSPDDAKACLEASHLFDARRVGANRLAKACGVGKPSARERLLLMDVVVAPGWYAELLLRIKRSGYPALITAHVSLGRDYERVVREAAREAGLALSAFIRACIRQAYTGE